MVTTFTTPVAAAGTFDAADWNTYVRDNLKALAYRPTIRAWDPGLIKDTDAVLTHNTWTSISWWSETWDTDSIHVTTAGNEHKLDPPAGTGTSSVWLVGATLTFEKGGEAGVRGVRLLDSAGTVWATVVDRPAHAGARTTVTVCAPMVLSDTADYAYVQGLQTSGDDLEVLAGNDTEALGSSAWMILLGSTSASSAGDDVNFDGWEPYGDVSSWWDAIVVTSMLRAWRRPMCRAYRDVASALSVASATWTTLTMPSENYDTNAMHSTATNTGRVSAPKEGYYLILAGGVFAADVGGTTRAMRMLIDGSAFGFQATQAVTDTSHLVSMQFAAFQYLNAAQYVELQLYQDSGAALDCSGWVSATWMGVRDPDIATRQRLTEGWQVVPFTAPTTYNYIPRAWVDIHTRDMPGLLYGPPAVNLQSQGSVEIQPGEWHTVKWNRQTIDSWATIEGKRNAGEKYVIPIDGLYLVGAQPNMKDLKVESVRFTTESQTFTAATTDLCTATAHGLTTGMEVTCWSTTTIPAGLTVGRIYFARRVTADTFRFYPTRGDAEDNTNQVDITSTGSGTHRVSRSILTADGLNLRTGMRVRFTTDGTIPNGLTTGTTDWWVIRIGPGRFRVADTEAQAISGIYTIINDNGSGTHTVRTMEPYGPRGIRVIHNGEIQAGWVGACSDNFDVGHPVVCLIAAQAEDEVWIEATTRAPEGSRLTAALPTSRWWCVWHAPLAYPSGAVAPSVYYR